jgi:hypothetical protein
LDSEQSHSTYTYATAVDVTRVVVTREASALPMPVYFRFGTFPPEHPDVG